MEKKKISRINNPIVTFAVLQSVNSFLPPKPFNHSKTLTVRAEPLTDVHEYGPLNGPLGVYVEIVFFLPTVYWPRFAYRWQKKSFNSRNKRVLE